MNYSWYQLRKINYIVVKIKQWRKKSVNVKPKVVFHTGLSELFGAEVLLGREVLLGTEVLLVLEPDCEVLLAVAEIWVISGELLFESVEDASPSPGSFVMIWPVYGGQCCDKIDGSMLEELSEELDMYSVYEWSVRSGWLKVVNVTGMRVVPIVKSSVFNSVFPHIPGCERIIIPVALP
jgi:hypothetical protein